MRWNSTKTYTEDDMIKMQQEAVNRVHDFQARAQMPDFFGYQEPVIEAQSRVLVPDEPEITAPPMPVHTQPTDPIRGMLEKFNIDSETLLILGLIFLLYNEKADNVLLIALAYLLL